MTMRQLAAEIKQRARQCGFDLVGIASAEPSKYQQYFRQWLDDGQAGTMRYLHERFEERVDPSRYLPGARSVICLAVNYHVPLNSESQSPDASVPEETGRIARYALGEDYHELVKSRLHALADWIRTTAPGAQTRCAVDTAPVMEKELAARAGIGWMGKNTCIINQRMGSWLFLGQIITTLDLPADEPAIDRCGTCRRCIEACPTGAIIAPYQLDARRCISYLTIEHRGPIPQEFHSQLGQWLFGCDVCQEVCPWNEKAPFTDDPSLQPRFADGRIGLHRVLSMKHDEYRRLFRGSAVRRVKLPVLQSNARILLENSAASTLGDSSPTVLPQRADSCQEP